jgi:hypothetical protein
MDFAQALKEVVWCLVTEGSISYRRIKRGFALDDDALEDLRRVRPRRGTPGVGAGDPPGPSRSFRSASAAGRGGSLKGRQSLARAICRARNGGT